MTKYTRIAGTPTKRTRKEKKRLVSYSLLGTFDASGGVDQCIVWSNERDGKSHPCQKNLLRMENIIELKKSNHRSDSDSPKCQCGSSYNDRHQFGPRDPSKVVRVADRKLLLGFGVLWFCHDFTKVWRNKMVATNPTRWSKRRSFLPSFQYQDDYFTKRILYRKQSEIP